MKHFRFFKFSIFRCSYSKQCKSLSQSFFLADTSIVTFPLLSLKLFFPVYKLPLISAKQYLNLSQYSVLELLQSFVIADGFRSFAEFLATPLYHPKNQTKT